MLPFGPGMIVGMNKIERMTLLRRAIAYDMECAHPPAYLRCLTASLLSIPPQSSPLLSIDRAILGGRIFVPGVPRAQPSSVVVV